MIEQPSFNELRRRSMGEMRGTVDRLQSIRSSNAELSLVDWIISERRLAFDKSHVRERHGNVDAVLGMSEWLRSSSGMAPCGAWFPLGGLLARDLSTGSTGLSSMASTTGVYPGSQLQLALSPLSAVMGGATVLTGLKGGDCELLCETTPAMDLSGKWVAEVASSSPVIDPSFRVVALAPKTVRFSINVSTVLLMNRKLNLEQALRRIILLRTLAEIDRAAYVGGGGNSLGGLLYDSGITLVAAGTNGAAPAWSHLVELEYQVGTRMGEMLTPAFITSPYLRKKLRTTAKGTGLDYILGKDARDLMGYSLRATVHSPDNLTKGSSSGVCSSLLFGDLSELVVAFFGPAAVDIFVDPVTRAELGEVVLQVRADVATAVRNPAAFAVYRDLLGA